ncbi:hypothetical protein OCU04_007218 [Sclerotinia nivalis]|uniref:AMP-dependent synthetase/ligase domain-containing protein n=1 Tax=Sclerotinia nivalis TaxID=352851 RepID=A0A9X0AM97_9HELO|nr:hypothetical protein OCU04_007218 [Sclerotinia nivalis]
MGSLGFFLNLLPIRFARSPPGTKISDMVKDTRKKANKSLENSFVPWNVLLHELKIPRSNTHAPISQLFVDYRQIARERSEWCGWKLSDEDWLNARNGYDLTLGITDNLTGESLLSLRFQKKLYSENSTNLFLRSYVNVLETMAEGLDLDIRDLLQWAPSDIETAMRVGRGKCLKSTAGSLKRSFGTDHDLGPSMRLDWPATVSHRIGRTIKEQSKKIALKDGFGNSLTYEQMRDRVNGIASALIAAGVIIESPIGVFQDPSADWICSMLAVFKVGGVYVPLDLRNSVARLKSIVEAAKPTIILTDLSTSSKVYEIGAANVIEIVAAKVANSAPNTLLANKARPDCSAVILFTSGTTGKPKGVILTRNNWRAQCEGYSRFCNLPSMVSVVLQQTNYNFDVSLDQIFAALTEGGCLYVVPSNKRGDPQAITEVMAQERVTYTVATPSEYEMWFRYARGNLSSCKSWRYAFGGGEHLHKRLIEEFASLAEQDLPELRLFNNYGPTEATLAIAKGEVSHSSSDFEDHVAAGFILQNYSVAVVDEALRPVPLEASGEIIAGGPGIAAGYLGLEGVVSEAFISGDKMHNLAANNSDTWYRTGDRGRLREDGALYVDGRISGDSQVKIRGFRIELGEIEMVLLDSAKGALSRAVVTARGAGEKRFLAAHVVFALEYLEQYYAAMIS